jgi:hypothetical protein
MCFDIKTIAAICQSIRASSPRACQNYKKMLYFKTTKLSCNDRMKKLKKKIISKIKPKNGKASNKQGKSKRYRLWRVLAGFWALFSMVLFIVEFLFFDKSDAVPNTASIIYVTILSIYAGTKEFHRWSRKEFTSQYWGEIFVVCWTIFMIGMIVYSLTLTKPLPEGLIGTYVAILTIFALTRRSKALYHRKHYK